MGHISSGSLGTTTVLLKMTIVDRVRGEDDGEEGTSSVDCTGIVLKIQKHNRMADMIAPTTSGSTKINTLTAHANTPTPTQNRTRLPSSMLM